MAPNERRGGRPPDDVIEIEQMLRQLRTRLPRLGAGVWIIVLVVVALWLSTGFYTVAPDEVGVVMRFGRLARVTDPGPHLLLPWPFESVLKTNVTEVKRIEVGFRTTVAGPPAQYEDVTEESHMLTGDENIVSLEFIAQYQVKRGADGGYAIQDYVFNLRPSASGERRLGGRPEGRMDGIVKQVAEAAMREVVGRHTIDSVLTEGKEAVQEQCRELMQKILDGYGAGVQVTTVQLQDVQPPTAEVTKYFKDVASAREDKVRALQEAEAYTNDLLPKARGEAEAIKAAAEGYAQSRIAEATGQANRFLSILKEYGQAREVTRQRLYLETMEEVFSEAEKVVIDSKAAGQFVPYLPLRGEGLVPREVPKPSAP
jgi:modulator of FtsH protease HflK